VCHVTVRIKPRCPGEENYIQNDRGIVELSNALRRGAEWDIYIQKKKHEYKGKKDIGTDPVPWPCYVDIHPNTYAEHCQLKQHCAWNRVPKSKPVTSFGTRIKWQVWTVCDPVQNPMAHCTKPNDKRSHEI